MGYHMVTILVPAPTPVVVSPVTTNVTFTPSGGPGPVGPAGPVDEETQAALEDHIAAEEPHPAYDDLPSFTLIFENGLI